MPLYCYTCNYCGRMVDELRPIRLRDEIKDCVICSEGQLKRDNSAELPAIHNTEKAFTPYFDIGVGKQINSRAEQKREWKKRGLVGLTGREFRDCYERGTANPKARYDEKKQAAAWERASNKGMKKAYDRRKAVISRI